MILAIWERDPPYDIDFPGNRFKVVVRAQRRAAISASASWPSRTRSRGRKSSAPWWRRSRPGVVLMGKRDFHPLSANFLLAKHLKSHWTNYAKGKAEAGQKADVDDWRVARTIFVADDDKMAPRYGGDDANSPYRHYFGNMRAKMMRGNRLYVFKSYKEQPDDEITLDYVMEHCVFAGSVNKVVDQILAMREETGDFGELVYAGMDWVDPAARQALDAADGRTGDAARQRGDRQAAGRGGRRGGVTRLTPRAACARRSPTSAPITSAPQAKAWIEKAAVALLGRRDCSRGCRPRGRRATPARAAPRPVVDVEREQPKRRQEDRHPFQRVHLHAEHPLEIGIAGGRRRLDAVFAARLGDRMPV